jgi:TusA-related sulfurtransferase
MKEMCAFLRKFVSWVKSLMPQKKSELKSETDSDRGKENQKLGEGSSIEAAVNTRDSQEYLHKLAKSKDPFERLDAARHINTYPDDLDELADDALPIQIAVAKNPSARKSTRERLASWDRHRTVLQAVAECPQTPDDILKNLKGYHECLRVRQAAETNLATRRGK